MPDRIEVAPPLRTDTFLTHNEAAALLRLSSAALHTLYCRARPNLPKRSRFGKRWLYRREDIEACLQADAEVAA